MVVGHGSSPSICPLTKKKHRKFRVIYFSSRKALQKARMNRSKKVSSKSAQASLGSLHRVLRFGGGGSAGHDEFEGQTLEAIQEDSEGANVLSNLGLQDDVSKVSCYNSSSFGPQL